MSRRTLHLKLRRDLWRLRGSVAAVALVAACGVAVFVTMQGAYDALVDARDRYYADYRFADIFARVRRAPVATLARVNRITGLAAFEDRIVDEATIAVPGVEDPATAIIVSLPDGSRPGINDVSIRAGRLPGPDARDEALVGEAFANAHHLHPGDTLHAVINGRWQRLRLTGIANSPEFVYAIGGTAVFPDDRRYAVLWMGRSALAAALDMTDGFNDLVARLAPGASERAVIEQLDAALAVHGTSGAHGRGEQISHQMLEGEIRQDRVTGVVVPAIFLAVASFLVHNVLSRLISLQRAQIGLLNAFGYRHRDIAAHYLWFSIAAIATGALAGVGLGHWLGGGLAGMYQRFFHFPQLQFELSLRTVALVLAIALATALAGAGPATRRVLALPAADAMRGATPPRFRPLLLERSGMAGRLTPVMRMVLRHLERRPWRALGAVLAIGLACALLVVGQFGLDALDETVRLQFRRARHDDVQLSLRDARGPAIEQDLSHLPGVRLAEGIRNAGARAGRGHRWRRVSILGLPAGADLHHIIGPDGQDIPIPPAGAVISRSLADILTVKTGDEMNIAFLEGRQRRVAVAVSGIVDDPIGLNVYMARNQLSRLMGEGPGVSGAYLRVDPARVSELHAALKRQPLVGSVTFRESTIRSFQSTVAENLRISMAILIGFACALAAGVVYNGARITLSEQADTLASLRVLGFTQGETSAILLGEQALITGLGIPAGLLMGYGLCAWLAFLLRTDLYRLPLFISPRTWGASCGVILAAAAVSALVVAWRTRHLDLIAVLKNHE
ncbi:MAG: FtsX-like permease family protein [Betaproteobacteria bacterium]